MILLQPRGMVSLTREWVKMGIPQLGGPSNRTLDWGHPLIRNHEAVCHWGGMSSGMTVRMLDQSLQVVAKFGYLLGQ